MLDTSFVLWLQQSASPALTEIMRAVSLCGYVPSCLAVAIVCGFGWRLRLGVTLILAIVFADAMTVAAKGAFASPRPHAVDARVRTFDAFESGLPRMATRHLGAGGRLRVSLRTRGNDRGMGPGSRLVSSETRGSSARQPHGSR